MSGAYVAKPAVVTPVDYPIGWNPIWPYPGTFPPGFNGPEYEWPDLPAEEEDPQAPGQSKPRIIVYPTSGLTTRESDDSVASGRSGSYFYVCLSSKPLRAASITVPVTSLDTTEGYVSTGDNLAVTTPSVSLEFNDRNWDQPRRINLAGRDDDADDGDVAYQILVGPSTSFDVSYSGMYGSNVSVTNLETRWELHVGISYQVSNDAYSALSWITGFARGYSWVKVTTPAASGSSYYSIQYNRDERLDYGPNFVGVTLLSITSTGSPSQFDVSSLTYISDHTSRKTKHFKVEYGVGTDAYTFGWAFSTADYARSTNSLSITARLYQDGELLDTFEDTLTSFYNFGADAGKPNSTQTAPAKIFTISDYVQ